MWALGNIATDSHVFRDAVLDTGLIECLMAFLGKKSPASEEQKEPKPSSSIPMKTLALICNTIQNLAGGMPEPPFKRVCVFIKPLEELLETKDSEVVTEALKALYSVTNFTGASINLDDILDKMTMAKAVFYLESDIIPIKTAALKLIDNLCANNQVFIEAAIDAKVLPQIYKILTSFAYAGLMETACELILEFTSSVSRNTTPIIEANILKVMCGFLQSQTVSLNVNDTKL